MDLKDKYDRLLDEFKSFKQKSKEKIERLTADKDQLEKKLQNQKEFYQKILDAVRNGVWITNENDIIVYCNKSLERIADVPSEKIVGRNLYTDFPEGSVKEFIKYYNKAKRHLKPIFYDGINVLTLGKTQRFRSGWLIPLKEQNQFTNMICTINDIRKIKRIREKLKDRESRYSAIVSSSSIGVARVDMKGRPLEMNTYLHNFLGYSEEELNDTHFQEFTHPEDKDIDLNLFRELVCGKREFYHIEKRYIHKSGKIIWGDLTATLVRDINDKPKYVISLVQDITKKKKALFELQRSKEKLKELNEKLESKVRARTKNLRQSEKKYKDAYQRVNLYQNLLTHDMNNILQNIRTSVDLNSIYLKDPPKSDKFKEINHILKEQVVRGARIIKNVSKLSQINKDFQLQNIDLYHQLKTTMDFIVKSYKSHKIIFFLNYDFNDLQVKANELLRDIFENLIMNAIIHNDSSHIEITINVSIISQDDKQMVQMEFIDNGVGIPDEKKDGLFKSKIGKGDSQHGVGLSLVKKIVDSYNGLIRVENKVEDDYTRGSKFILTLPKAD
ncbi:MAG: PAS domain S-box protein [Promethearchaeia archaeon]